MVSHLTLEWETVFDIEKTRNSLKVFIRTIIIINIKHEIQGKLATCYILLSFTRSVHSGRLERDCNVGQGEALYPFLSDKLPIMTLSY